MGVGGRGLRAAVGAVAWALCAPSAAAVPDAARLDRLEQLAWADPDKAVEALQPALAEAPEDSVAHLELLRILGSAQVWRNDLAAVDELLARLDRLASGAPDAEQRRDAGALAACVRGARQRKSGTMGRADALLQAADEARRQARSPGLRQGCALIHANVKESLGQYEDAMRLLQDAIRDADDTGPSWRRSELRTTLSDVLWRAGQREAAQEMLQQALRLARLRGDRLAHSHAQTVAAMQAGARGLVDEERQALEEALALAREADALSDEAHCLANLSDFHLRHDQPEKALAVAERALPLARRTRNVLAEGVAQVNAGLALILLHRKDEGLRLVRASIESDLRMDDVLSASDSLQDLGQYLERAGYYAEAYDAFREHRQIADDLARRNRQRQLVELQESFEADRRDHERRRLLQDNQLKEELWRERELSARFWFLMTGAAGVLAALAALLYHRMRSARAELDASHRQLRADSAVDPLTGLANRRAFPLGQAGPAQGALLLIDLDHFKRVNDRHGHQVGDAVLVEVARRLRAAVRDPDLLVRWGGEEFLLLVSGPGAVDAAGLATRLLGLLADEPVALDDRAVPVSGSIGLARFPLPGGAEPTWAEALGLVDAALYLAKSGGRNRACEVLALPGLAPSAWPDVCADLEAAAQRGEVRLQMLHGPWQADGGAP